MLKSIPFAYWKIKHWVFFDFSDIKKTADPNFLSQNTVEILLFFSMEK